MSNFIDLLMTDIKVAMKAKDATTLNPLRAIKTAMTNTAIEQKKSVAELTQPEGLAIIRKQIKQRQDSITQFEKAGRSELAETEKSEIDILKKYLPPPPTAEELDALVTDTITELGAESKADMGKVMKAVQQKTAGAADGKALSQLVMAKLSGAR